MGRISEFIEANKKWCDEFLDRHPLDNVDMNKVYNLTVAGHLKPGVVVYDVGGGRHCRYVKNLNRDNMYCFALSKNPERLDVGSDFDDKIICDVCNKIPLPYGKVDMITSAAACEHMTNPKAYYKNAYSSLKDKGLFINVFSCRYGFFTTLHRMLPNEIAKRAFRISVAGIKKELRFPINYPDLYYQKVLDDYIECGFKIEKIYLNYLQANNFTFFVPLFLANYVWDWCMKKLQVRNMCTQMMIVAKKI